MRFFEQQCGLDLYLENGKRKSPKWRVVFSLSLLVSPWMWKRVFDFSHFDGTESAGCYIFTDNPNPMPACMVWIFDKATNISSYSSMSFICGFKDLKKKHRLANLSLVALYLEIVSADKLAGFGYIYALSNDGIIPMPDHETACRMSGDRPELCNNESTYSWGWGYSFPIFIVSMTTVIICCFIFWVSF